MNKEKLNYCQLPVHIRLLFLLIGFTGFSAALHGVAALFYRITTNGSSLAFFWLSLVVTFGTMNSLKRRNMKSYRKAALLFLLMPAYYLFIAIFQIEVTSEHFKLFYSWPLFNSVLFIICFIVIANKRTYLFYSKKVAKK